jgi:type IV pilus assembly protein PilP
MRTLSLTSIALTLIAALAHAQAPPPATHAAATTPVVGTPATPATPTTPGAATTPAAQTTPAAPAAEASTADDRSNAAEPQGFTYNPEGRRDPFVSLLRRGDSRSSGPKMAGLGGLGTSEVSLRGVLTSEGDFVGILHGVDSKNYIVRVGDKLSDGFIRSISKDSMVILQQVNDPLSLEKEREVRKLLRQTEEAK